MSTQKQASDGLYKTEFKKMIGKGPHDAVQAYPEYKHFQEVSKTNSKVCLCKLAMLSGMITVTNV